MKKYLKYAFIALAAITLLLTGLAVFIAATFDPNAYKPEIIQLVKEKKQRELKLDGDIKLTLFPGIGADFGKLSLSEHNSGQEFATVENARVSLALMPLLKKQLVVKEIIVKGLKVNLIRHKDGRTNIDDLLAKEEEKPEPFKFDIDRVLVENTALNFLDETKGSQIVLTDINLKTGRIINRVPDKMELAFNTRINLATRLKIQLTARLMVALDPGPRQHSNSGSVRNGAMTLDLESSKGDLVIQAKLASPLTGNLETRQLHLPNLTIAISTASTDVSSIKGDLQGSVTVDGIKQNVQANLAGKVADSNIKAKLEVAGFANPAYNFDVDIDQLDLDRFLPPQQALQTEKEKNLGGPLDYGRSPVSALKNLNANGSIRIASLKAGNIKSSGVLFEIKPNPKVP